MKKLLIIATVFMLSGCVKSAEDMVKATAYCTSAGMATKTHRYGNGQVNYISCITPAGDEFTAKY